jgi:glycine cleavage system H protein
MSKRDLRFTKSHEWLKMKGNDALIGLTDYAQGELGDIVFVELPAAGTHVAAGDVLTTVESVKSVSEIYAPVAGDVVDANAALEDSPDLVNSDPYGEGWIVKLKVDDASAVDGLMTADEYEEHTKG